MNYKLKPCPFCGNKAEIFEHKFSSMPTFSVICPRCMVQTYQAYFNKDDAIKVWNRRVEEEKRGKRR